jgi:hypothetical protein
MNSPPNSPILGGFRPFKLNNSYLDSAMPPFDDISSNVVRLTINGTIPAAYQLYGKNRPISILSFSFDFRGDTLG